MMKNIAMMTVLCCLSMTAWASDDRQYFPLSSDKEWYADMNSVRVHPDNDNLITINFISNVSSLQKSSVEINHINCRSGVLIHRPRAVVDMYDGLYGRGEKLFSIPVQSEKVELSQRPTTLTLLSALACNKVGKPLFDNPKILGEFKDQLTSK